MTQEEILEGNKLIAEFMEVQKDINGNYHINNVPHILASCIISVDYLQYHSSWDWLMTVVEKIAVETKHPTYLYFSHIQNSAIIHELKQDYSIIRESETRRTYTPLQVTYKAVIEFIKWHKQQTK